MLDLKEIFTQSVKPVVSEQKQIRALVQHTKRCFFWFYITAVISLSLFE